MKKLICMMMILIMMFTFCIPAVGATADDTPETPTIEEILNEYCQKSFDAQYSEISDPSASYSRQSGSGTQTLEQETVDQLTAAGYEAYNVTAANYGTLEELLKTDFEAMGLDRNSSYIIVISGESDDGTVGQQPQPASVPLPDLVDPGDGGTEGFLYYYEPFDRQYRMRYTTVVYPAVTETVNVTSTFGSAYANTLANSDVTGYVDSNSIYTTGRELGCLRNLFGLSASYTYSVPTLSIQCSVIWTRHYIDILDETLNSWVHTTYTEYATIDTAFTGNYYNNRTHTNQSVNYNTRTIIYSPYFTNNYPEEMKITAIYYFMGYPKTHYRTHEIQIYTVNSSGTKTILLTIYEPY